MCGSLATSQTQEHTEIQLCKSQDPARLYPINHIYFFSITSYRMQHFIELYWNQQDKVLEHVMIQVSKHPVVLYIFAVCNVSESMQGTVQVVWAQGT
jgi:hypothetical protein